MDQDWIFRTSGPLIAASQSANMSTAQRKQMSGLAWLQAKHRELMSMPEDKATSAYDQLDRKVQQSLEGLFGNTTYNPEETSFWGNAAKYLGKPFQEIGHALSSYSEFLGQPLRAFSIMDEVGSFSEAWVKAEDGKRFFDSDRADQIEKFYGPVISKITKRISSGDSFGAVISDLETDAEFAAMEKLLQGDEKMTRALRDWDQAKVSYGRSLAHLFNLNPDIGAKDQGLEGKVFKGVSGVTDLAANIVLDPATWMFAPISAYRKATLGLTYLARAEQGTMSIGQKIFTKFGAATTLDQAFTNPKVVNAFDAIGEQVKIASKSNKATDLGQKSAARMKIKELMPTLDENAIDQLIYHRVHSATDALRFMKDGRSLEKIMIGKSGSDTMMLPTLGPRRNLLNSTRDLVHSVTGYNKSVKEIDETAFKGSYLEQLTRGQTAADTIQAKNMLSFSRKVARSLERALIDNSVYVGGYDELGRNMAARSAGNIFTLSRVVFDKAVSRQVAHAYVAGTVAERRNIVKGLYATILDKSGLSQTEKGKAYVEELLGHFDNHVYSESTILSEETAKVVGLKPGTQYVADEVNGQKLANALYHTTNQISLPSLVGIYNRVQKDGVLKSLKGYNQAATDAWSALNLIPRLGVRSVMDEGLFHALSMPIVVMRNLFAGYSGSTTQRLMQDPEGKNVGLVARHFFDKLFDDVSPEDIMKARANEKFAGELLEKQLTSKILGKTVFAGARGTRNARYMADSIRYNGLQQIRGLSEGFGKSVATSKSSMGNGVDTVLEFSPELAKDMKARGIVLGGDPTTITKGSAAFLTNAHIQLVSRVDRNGDIGKIAVAFMEKPDVAVAKIASYLRKNPKVYRRFDRSSSNLTTVESDAFSMYMQVRNIFSNSMDELNVALLDKVRKNGYGSRFDEITATKLSHDDIVSVQGGFKNELFGYGREVKTFQRFGDSVDEMLNGAFDVMDRQLATLSREPAVNAYYLHYRDQFASAEKAFVRDYMKKNDTATLEEAKDVAARRYTNLATDMSINKVLGYIDNPHVRSNLAFSARNIARYYRATEDFYRRAGRVLRDEGARAVVRLRIANESLDHAGFIHEDDNGDKYFTMPVDQIMYNVYAPVLQLLGVEVKRPMPLAMSGKIKMLTPSLDPESNLPTLAGPLISMTWTALKNIVPDEYADGVTKTLFGQYATNTDMYDALMPSTLKRVWTAVKAGSGMEEEQVASATMKSMAFYAANGMAPGSDSTQSERDQYLYDVKATARSLVFIRNMFGIISPVSPQFAAIQDVPPEILKAGAVSFKKEFQNIVSAEQKKGNDNAWNDAILKWTKLNPGRLVYTIPEGEANTIAPIAKTKEAVNWLKQNGSFAGKYKSAAVFLMPRGGEFNMDAYSFLKREGYIQTKDIDTYFEEVTNIRAENEYYDVKHKYEDLAKNTGSSQQIAFYNAQMDQELKAIRESNPYLARKQEQFDSGVQLKKDAIVNMQEALASGMIPESDTTDRIRRMIAVFNQMYPQIGLMTSQSDTIHNQKLGLKAYTTSELLRIAGSNPNATLFYDTILKRLLG